MQGDGRRPLPLGEVVEGAGQAAGGAGDVKEAAGEADRRGRIVRRHPDVQHREPGHPEEAGEATPPAPPRARPPRGGRRATTSGPRGADPWRLPAGDQNRLAYSLSPGIMIRWPA